MAVFHFFQSSCGMSCAVHTKRHSGLVILVLLTLLDFLVVVLNFFQPPCGMSYAFHNKGHNGLAILVFLAFLTLLVVVF